MSVDNDFIRDIGQVVIESDEIHNIMTIEYILDTEGVPIIISIAPLTDYMVDNNTMKQKVLKESLDMISILDNVLTFNKEDMRSIELRDAWKLYQVTVWNMEVVASEMDWPKQPAKVA